jgi:hypothetical protein
MLAAFVVSRRNAPQGRSYAEERVAFRPARCRDVGIGDDKPKTKH